MRSTTGILLTFLLLCQTLVSGTEPREALPNILIIYADDVGYGDLSCYGAKLIQTPHLDRLASQGVRFTDAYCTAATCTPSRYSLLTGEYAFRNQRAQVLRGDAPLLIQPGSMTMPEVLRRAGYRTSIVGKWHLGLGEGDVDWNGDIKPGPLEVGFDESFIIPATNDRVPTVYIKGHRVDNWSDQDDPIRVSYQKPIGDLPTGISHPELLRYPADRQHSGTITGDISRIGWMDGGQSAWWADEDMAYELARHAVKFLEQNRESRFFLFLSMHENHVPRAPHPDFVGSSKTGLRGDAIVEFDWVVGEMMRTLERLQLCDNTLVIFSSDNGPVFFDGYEDGALEHANGHPASGPFRGGKYQPFEGGTRMPTIVRWPGRTPAGSVSSALVSQVDLLASLAALVDQDLSDEVASDSQNQLAAWLGQDPQGRDYVIQQPAGPVLAIRQGDWKYIPAGNRPVWAEQRHNLRNGPLASAPLTKNAYLFHLGDDPGEQTNVIDQHPEVARHLHRLLQETIQRGDRSAPNSDQNAIRP